jgi:RimJ/RimL family protein N-acetyltransferase
VQIALPDRLGTDPVLRRHRVQDAAVHAAAFVADPELGPSLGIEHDPDEAIARERPERAERLAADGVLADLAVADGATDAFLGAVLLHSFDWAHRRAEVGFWLVPAARGRGLGTAAVALMLEWAFGALDLLRVEMTTTPDNMAIPPLAARLGFAREGLLRRRNVERGRRVDVVWFGLLREEWQASSAVAGR